MSEYGKEPVYPQIAGDVAWTSYEGVTLREHYAGLAMQGLLTRLNGNAPWTDHLVASEAVRYADALLAALEEARG